MNKQTLLKTAQLDSGAPTREELELINRYTRRELAADEVYVFTAALCDNDVDRDGERFTVEALRELERLFVGKTGIFDHNPSARNQAARIISCSVEEVPGKLTATGESCFVLKARAYIPRTEGNRELIEALDTGIIKEVSVGCSVEKTLCSICHGEISVCGHRKGEVYDGKICCGELTNPLDAYEFSFVAVPAQRCAGVTKASKKALPHAGANQEGIGKERPMENIITKLSKGAAVSFSAEESKAISKLIEELQSSARDGRIYRKRLSDDVLRMSAAVQPEISRATMESVVKGMSIEQLEEFQTAYRRRIDSELAPVPQLRPQKHRTENRGNGQFTI